MHTINTHKASHRNRREKLHDENFCLRILEKKIKGKKVFFLHIQELGNKNVIKKFRKLSFYICIFHLSNQSEVFV